MKILYVGHDGKIISGALAGTKGRVVAFDTEWNQATVMLDKDTLVKVKSEMIEQDVSE